MSKFRDPLFVDREKKYRGFKKLLEPATKQSVMLIKSPEKMGKTWLAMKLELHCNTADVNLPVARINFRNPLEQLKITDHLAWIRLLRDRLNEPEYFNQLNATINQLTAGTISSVNAPTGTRDLAELAQAIQKVFNLAELRQQALFLDLQFENVNGNTLFEKSYGIVAHFARRNTLAKLFDMLESERPNVDWKEQFANLYEEQAGSGFRPNVSPLAPVVDQNISLVGASLEEVTHAERLINDAFFDAVANLIAARKQVVFLLDAFESTPPIAADFITNQLLVRLLDDRLRDMVIVISGREIPDISDLGIRDLVVETGLDSFNAQYVRDFMVSREIPEDTGGGVDAALLFSGGVPGILALMADQVKLTLQGDDDFFD